MPGPIQFGILRHQAIQGNVAREIAVAIQVESRQPIESQWGHNLVCCSKLGPSSSSYMVTVSRLTVKSPEHKSQQYYKQKFPRNTGGEAMIFWENPGQPTEAKLSSRTMSICTAGHHHYDNTTMFCKPILQDGLRFYCWKLMCRRVSACWWIRQAPHSSRMWRANPSAPPKPYATSCTCNWNINKCQQSLNEKVSTYSPWMAIMSTGCAECFLRQRLIAPRRQR